MNIEYIYTPGRLSYRGLSTARLIVLSTGCFTAVVVLPGGFTLFELRGFLRVVACGFAAAAGVEEETLWDRGFRGRAELTESRLVEHLLRDEEKIKCL